MPVLDSAELASRLQGLDGWSLRDGQITRTYDAATFPRAVAFVVEVAMLAEAADHHPDIDIRYNRVSLALSTHSEGGITEKDFTLAAQCDAVF